MATFTPAAGLDEMVARLVAPAITSLGRTAAEGAKVAAPRDKAWITHEDERVRPEHEKAHGQRRPTNLRFVLDSPEYDQAHYGAGEIQLGVAPGDEHGFTPGNFMNCRCSALITADSALADGITAHDAQVAGTSVSATVTCDHELAVNAELGNDVDNGARFMAAGLHAAAARLSR